MTDTDWTPARISRMIALKRKGYSARQIAQDLGATTRNAVVGKLDRLGLNGSRTRRKDIPTSDASTNQGVKTKVLAFDVSPADLLRPRRFSWEGDSA